ncbi:MAG: hypothetical protein FJ118_12715 [Deltaproteobacteria bacterium]|nr:hypothetical protein [Deltaproteobacteria bacterium]
MQSHHQPILLLHSLGEGHPGITTAIAAYCSEAASLCLEDQGHLPGVKMEVAGAHTLSCVLQWETGDARKVVSWDKDDATECGASVIAILVVDHLTGLKVIERAQKGDRVDYWLGKADNDDEPPFLREGRLEVSGIRRGDESIVRNRVRSKVQRLKLSSSNIKAFVVVVEFGTPMSQVQES